MLINKNKNTGFIYIIKLREFCVSNEETYKIGRTLRTIKERMRGYPKNSKVIHNTKVFKPKVAERILIKKFIEKFEHKKEEYGNEYFSGDINGMIKVFDAIAIKYKIIESNKNDNNNNDNNNINDNNININNDNKDDNNKENQ